MSGSGYNKGRRSFKMIWARNDASSTGIERNRSQITACLERRDAVVRIFRMEASENADMEANSLRSASTSAMLRGRSGSKLS